MCYIISRMCYIISRMCYIISRMCYIMLYLILHKKNLMIPKRANQKPSLEEVHKIQCPKAKKKKSRNNKCVVIFKGLIQMFFIFCFDGKRRYDFFFPFLILNKWNIKTNDYSVYIILCSRLIQNTHIRCHLKHNKITDTQNVVARNQSDIRNWKFWNSDKRNRLRGN